MEYLNFKSYTACPPGVCFVDRINCNLSVRLVLWKCHRRIMVLNKFLLASTTDHFLFDADDVSSVVVSNTT